MDRKTIFEIISQTPFLKSFIQQKEGRLYTQVKTDVLRKYIEESNLDVRKTKDGKKQQVVYTLPGKKQDYYPKEIYITNLQEKDGVKSGTYTSRCVMEAQTKYVRSDLTLSEYEKETIVGIINHHIRHHNNAWNVIGYKIRDKIRKSMKLE